MNLKCMYSLHTEMCWFKLDTFSSNKQNVVWLIGDVEK